MGRFHRHDDDTAHNHDHAHSVGASGHDHDHAHTHEHQHVHSHKHEHADGTVHSHAHAHSHTHEHGPHHHDAHGHGHCAAHSHGHCHHDGQFNGHTPELHIHIHGHAGHVHLHFDQDAACHSRPHGHIHTHEHTHGEVVHSHEHTHVHDHPHAPGHHGDSDHAHTHGATVTTNNVHEELGDHSGYQTGAERIQVLEDIFAENDHCAENNKNQFDQHNVTAVNIMSSPGSGKTTLLQRTLETLGKRTPPVRVGIVEGDIETALDADRLHGHGAQISLLNTGNGFGGECHLDAPMVAHALEALDLEALDLVLIENVGNLVCPAEFEVGAHARAMVYSVTEGEDKPVKYPVMFRSVDVVVVNKVDLLPHLNFDMGLFLANLHKVNPGVRVIETTATSGDGVEEWVDWLVERMSAAS